MIVPGNMLQSALHTPLNRYVELAQMVQMLLKLPS